MAAHLDPRVENLDQELDCAEYYGSETEDSETGTDTISWISWFCSYEGHEYFVEVPEDYIDDEFNLTGLRQIVPHYTQAIHMILDLEDDFDEGNWDGTTKPDIQDIEDSAERLYGLIHARYIITRQGLHQMAEKYVAGQFGSCPRYHCKNTFVLPCGLSDSPNFDAVKLFCPNCKDLYSPASTRFSTVDGAYFGTTFPHMFFLTFPEYLVNGQIGDKYLARIYGFKVNELSKSGPRMQWLRCLAEDAEILKVAQAGVGTNEGDSDDQQGNVNRPQPGGPNGGPAMAAPAQASGQLSSQPSDMQQSPNSPTQDAVMAAPANDGAMVASISRLDDVDDLMVDSSQPSSNPLSPTKDIMNGIENTHLKT